MRTAATPSVTALSPIRGASSCSTWATNKGVGFADIDLKRISEVRSRIPALNHRRPIPDAVAL